MKIYLIALIIFATLLLLDGCDKYPKPNKELDRKEIVLKVHSFSSKSELQRVIGKRSGMAKWSPDDNICDIYIVDWDFNTAGHELHHCMYGSFHAE
jgi:hypothetical protein